MKPFFLFLLLSSCGYRGVGDGSDDPISTTISMPYIKGDTEGRLALALSSAIHESGVFDYSYSGGNCVLEVSIVSDSDDRIGFRYDRDPTSGVLRDNIVGTENRRSLGVEIQLLDAHTEKVLFGPEVIRATTDYDYVDGNSILDLVFFKKGSPQTVLDFSLAQLDSVEGAHDDTDEVIYKRVAEKIVHRLILQRLEKKPVQVVD